MSKKRNKAAKRSCDAEGQAEGATEAKGPSVLKSTGMWALSVVIWTIFWMLMCSVVLLTGMSAIPLLGSEIAASSGVTSEVGWYTWAVLVIVPVAFVAIATLVGELLAIRYLASAVSRALARVRGRIGA